MYNIGVRYCGGCNSYYDRVALVRKLGSMLKNVYFTDAVPGEDYPAVLIVCGCKRVCVKANDLTVASDKLIYITGWDCLMGTKEKLTALLNASNEEKVLSFNSEEIRKVLPHRPPILLIDSAEKVVPGKEAKAEFTLRPETEVLKGHFPDEPMMPGVYALEAMAQTADLLILTINGNEGSVPLFAGCSRANFRKPVLPGTRIIIYANAVKSRPELGIYKCEAKIMAEDELCADADIRIVLKKKQ